MEKMLVYHDAFGNTATITPKWILPYKGAMKTVQSFVLSLTADYDNDFLYHVSVHETLEEAEKNMMKCSCGTWRF